MLNNFLVLLKEECYNYLVYLKDEDYNLKNMNNKNIVILNLALGAILLVLIFIINTSQIKIPNLFGVKTVTQTKTPSLSIAPGEALIKETVFDHKPGPGLTRHSFEGDVKAITNDPERKIILVNSTGLNPPDFVSRDKTRFWKKVGTEFVQSSLSDVKIGSHVDIHMDKDDKDGFWICRDIYILE